MYFADFSNNNLLIQENMELQVPIIYDIDCGHVPPQITFINGAYAEVELCSGKGGSHNILYDTCFINVDMKRFQRG